MIALIPRRVLIRAMAAGLAGAAMPVAVSRAAGLSSAAPRATRISAHDFALPAIGGGIIDMADFAGRPVLVVNTASNCAYTPQYEGLQKLHEEFGPAGLVVLGVPSADFGNQEPGDAARIVSFTSGTYHVNFPLTAKMHLRGSGTDGFFRWLQAEGGPARWNFHKWLIGADGKVIAAFDSPTRPDDPGLVAAIRSAFVTRPGT